MLIGFYCTAQYVEVQSKQEAQLPQRDRATPSTHFTRDRRTDRRKDGQKAVARTSVVTIEIIISI